MTKLPQTPMSVEEFLLCQEIQQVPHELFDGRPRLKTGGTSAHNDIATNVLFALTNRLRGKL